MVKNLPSVERSTKIRFGKHVPDSNDQEENTIVFNASNVAVPTPYSNAVYLSPIRNRTDYTAPEIVLLMYDRNTKEVTESGESANALIGGSTLDAVTNRNNATSNVVQLTGVPESLITYGNVGIANTLAAHTLSVGSNLYIDEFGSNVLVVSGNVAVLQDMVIDGNLRVNGDTTVVYTENISIRDAFIELGQNNTSGDTTLDLGVLMHRPDPLSNVVIGYREGTDEFAIAYTDAQPTDKIFTPKTDEDINVHVYGLTHVDANIYAHEDVLVTGNVYVSTNVSVTEELTVTGNVYADKDLEVVGNAYVSGNVVASKDLTLSGNAYVTGNVVASKDLTLTGNAYVSGNVNVTKELTITGNVYADKDFELAGNAYVSGNVNVTKQLSVTGNAYVSGNVEVTKALIVSANTHLKGDNVFITNTLDFLDPTTAIVTDQVSNVQIRLGQLENVSNLASNPRTNQVLRYINNEWSNDYPQQNFTRVKNGYSIAEGRTLYKGNTVYVSATQNAGLVQVRAAQSHVASQMPCIGIVYEDIGPEAEGVVLTYGILNNLNTTHLTAGGTVYVSNVYSGYHTSVKPDDDVGASPDLIQNLGICTRSHASSGAIFVTGIGRANDIPNAELITDYNNMQYVYVNNTNNDLKKITSANLNIPLTTAVSSSSNSAANAVTLRGVSITSGDGFHGDLVVAGNVTVDTNTFKVDAEANRVGILTASPGQTLDVRGAANVGTLTTTSASVTDTTHSTSKDTGVLIVTNGGLGVEANIHSTNVFAASHIAVGTSATTKALDVRGTSNVGVFTTPDATVTDSTAATSTSTGALKVTGGAGIQGDLYANDGHFTADLSVGNLTDLNNKYLPMVGTDGTFIKSPVYVTPEGKYVISAASAEFLGNITLAGNTTIIASNSVTIADRIFGVGANNSATGLDSGFMIEHQDGGTFANIALIHHADEHRFSIGYTQNTFADNHILHHQHADGTILRVDLLGNVLVQNNLSVSKNVGIGTTNPGFKLDVRGTSNVGALSTDSITISDSTAATNKTSGALQVTGGVGIQGALYGAAATFDGVTSITNSTAATGKTDGALVVTGGTGISGALYGAAATFDGVTSVTNSTAATGKTDGALVVTGGVGVSGALYGAAATFDGVTSVTNSTAATGKTDGALVVTGGVGISGAVYGAAATFDGLTVDTSTLVVDATNDYVGVGTATPDATLHVTGNTYISSNLEVGTANLFVDIETGQVGIGKTNPAYDLDVNGDINFSGTFYQGGSPFVSTPWTIDGNDLEYTSGNIGIGTDAANATLHVGGNIYSTSNITAYEIEVSNVTTTNLIMNAVTISSTLSFDNTVSVSNISSNTLQFTNGNTSAITTSNVVVGGIVKQTSVPAFTVRLTDGTIVGPGDIDYNQVDTDNTNSYTTANGRFTAPVAGHYFFAAHGIYQNDVTVYDFTINGTRQNINSLCSAPSANYIQCSISAVLNLSEGQYVNVYQVEGGTFGTDNNVFTGFFIG